VRNRTLSIIRRRDVVSALAVAFVLLLAAAARAEDTIPAPTGMVNDFAHVLSGPEKEGLETKLKQLKQARGVEIAVVTVETTHGETPFDYSMRMIRQWGVGDKDRGGVLFLVVTKDRQISVRVSTHAEGTITDSMAGEGRDAAAPFFKKGQWGAGLGAGVDKLIQRVEAAAQTDPLLQKPSPTPKPEGSSKDLAVGLMFVGIMVFAIVAGVILVVVLVMLVLSKLAASAGNRPRRSRFASGVSDDSRYDSSGTTYSSSYESSSSSSSSYDSSSSSSSDSGSSGFGGDSSSGGGADGGF
jgi:uncharacterized protein